MGLPIFFDSSRGLASDSESESDFSPSSELWQGFRLVGGGIGCRLGLFGCHLRAIKAALKRLYSSALLIGSILFEVKVIKFNRFD